MIPTRSASWSASSRYWVVRKTVVPSSLSADDLLPDRLAADRVEAGGRLVEKQHPRLVDERRGEVEAPAHAARVGADAAVGRLGEPDASEQLVAPGLGGAAGERVQGGLETDRLAAGHQRVERRLLERDADRPPHLRRLGDHVVARDPRRAAGGAQQRGQHPYRRRLAGAVWTQEGVDLTLGNLEVDAVDGPDAALELAFEPCDVDCRHGGGIYRRAPAHLSYARCRDRNPAPRSVLRETPWPHSPPAPGSSPPRSAR